MLDILIVIILALGAYSGYQKGLFIGVLSILAFFIGLLLAFKFMDWGTAFLAERVENLTYMLPLVSFMVIFLGVVILLRILAFLVKKTLDLTILGTFDNFAGAILGFLKWAFMVSLLIWITGSFQIEIPYLDKSESKLYPVVEPIAPLVISFLDSFSPVIQESVNSIRDLINQTAGGIIN
ncbi:CvpA family protein [Pararhodonellum marinum]|uniref:CvpA family protein n=1 Tax=Pararhodonellum marinum TaxID=2755358 RepID=UPI00188F682E|nr:CvpA family protein [Pararhodonellum marinum]